MKKVIVFIALAFVVGVAFIACQKEEEIFPSQSEMTRTAPPSLVDDTSINQTKAGTMTEYLVSPKFGKPNSTSYTFKVYDPSGALPLSVKFNERATGAITYKAMTRSGNYWVLSTTIAINGWYDWKYVYSNTQQGISSNYYQLCNSKNMFNSSPLAIVWPFGADGSSWNNRSGSAGRLWNGGQEGGNGNGWGHGGHVGIKEQYSDDWNRGNGSQDRYAEIRSPLDGYVEEKGTYPTNDGDKISFYVSIVQEINGVKYRFYVGHLEEIPNDLFVGQYVRAGYTKIGRLGMSGAIGPHAHTNLRNITNGAKTSVQFYFNAQ